MKRITALIAVAEAATASRNESSASRGLQTTTAPFCWLNSYPRGVGKVPSSCAAGQERIGLLCYPNCPPGMSRKGLDCHSNCPEGLEDQGLFCRKKEYGRGVGFPWKYGDGLSDHGMFERCEAAHGTGNCEKYGLIVYPKCEEGYTAFGCSTCRPKPPNCQEYGLAGRFDLSCAKKVVIGDPELGTCASGEERDAGLCYKQCKTGFSGVGPVCWGPPPSGWVRCGMGAATTSTQCAEIMVDQIMSVGEMVLNVCTAFSSSSAKALQAPVDSEILAKLKNGWKSIKSKPEVKNAIKAYENADRVKTGYEAIEDLEEARTAEDYVRFAATIASILDPTGMAGVIAAYTYSTCDKVAPPDNCILDD
ncbi:hypothetical protein DYB32_006254 [Aphanomyces invadans]|uniref:Uncharacterized protein n=1 Tax=Aphanomyces invadans TaxID=157072 RepID=A0A3R7CYF0_9STRA|nr:hypothetical protein DYB32_006254 [Aphanomyces invadans]